MITKCLMNPYWIEKGFNVLEHGRVALTNDVDFSLNLGATGSASVFSQR